MDIHDLIPNVALGNIPAIGGVVSESEIRNAVERANPTSTII
jgi:hypothetical protein